MPLIAGPTLRRWWCMWLSLTLLAALGLTLLDAVLLQRKHNLFTGGFLSINHLQSPEQVVVFLVGSVLADTAVTGLLTVLGLLLATWLGLNSTACALLTLALSTGPLLVADVVSYHIFTYLGAAFDLHLMFDMVGRSLADFWAVTNAHLPWLSTFVGCGLLLVVALIWIIAKWAPGGRWSRIEDWPGWHRSLGWPVLLFLVGLIASTALRLAHDSFDSGLGRKPSGQILGAVVAFVTDVGRNGARLLSAPRDRALFDARIDPYAVDWPGNGVDENGVGGDLPADFSKYMEDRSEAPQWRHRPDVIFFLLETIRADVVGMRLNGQPVTPVLDDLGRRGASARAAYSHNGFTIQSRFHVFSGSLANLRGKTSLLDDFNANSYETAYFSGQDESFGNDKLPIGFERASFFYDARQDRAKRYTTFATPASLAVPFTVVQERIRAFLARRRPGRPLFLYVNFHDPHFPYHHAGIQPLIGTTVVPQAGLLPSRRDEIWQMYLNTVANVDRAVGALVADVMQSTGRTPGVIVTADHGESLFDEGFLGHGYVLNEVQTRVPLIVANLPLIIREPWGQMDLRDALRRALMTESLATLPIVQPGRAPVFQYLGEISKPRQIAFVTPAGRTIYDFRQDRFQLLDGVWRRPAELKGTERDAFLQLLRFWESMIVARATMGEGSATLRPWPAVKAASAVE
ncbi:MAG: sulfatase-like hydrolase/transferase [Deltaproteobacteria bacterium]|nr:sulfatase-like hydrolase/transferase [Deltaproteobacteria bacterium]